MIIFFVRRYNDIDHTVPIVYRMAKDGYKDLIILCMNSNIDIETDFRLKFLKNTYGIKISYTTHYFWPDNTVDKIWSFITSGMYYRRAIRNKKTNKYINAALVKKLKSKNVTLLLFDWQNANKYFFTSSILSASKDLNIPNICIPHGMTLATNDNWSTDPHSQNGQVPVHSKSWEDFDDFIFQFKNEGHCRLAKYYANVEPEKIHVIGCTRFCDEWRQIYHNILPRNGKQNQENGKLKVVYIDHSSLFRIKKTVVEASVKQIANLDFVDLIIKPSTSAQEKKKGGISSDRLSQFSPVCYETSSTELCEWADVVMGTTSSILLEPLLMKKIFIYPKHFCENQFLYEEMNACWVVNSDRELINALQKINIDRGYKPYSQENVDSFIKCVVYSGKRNRDVLGEYKDFILSRALVS